MNNETKQLLLENEAKTNKYVVRFLLLAEVAFAVFCVLAYTEQLYFTFKATVCCTAFFTVVTLLFYLWLRRCEGKHPLMKHLLIVYILFISLIVCVASVYGSYLMFALAIFVSACYYDVNFTLRAGIADIGMMILATFLALPYNMRSFVYDIGAVEAVPAGAVLKVEESLGRTLLEAGYVTREALLWNSALVAAAAAIVLLMCIIFAVTIAQNGRKLLAEQAEANAAKSALVISQIQPHFLYNSLATISALCRINPERARTAIDSFSTYMRTNLDTLRESKLVPFSKELEHTQTYLDMEQLRFGDDLQIEYDIQCTDFELPSLSLQPIVENAVKHGICNVDRAGLLTISTEREGRGVLITVQDNGAGFDPGEVKEMDDSGRSHSGIRSVADRLQMMCGGILHVDSAPGEGTTVTIYIPE